MPKQFIGRNTIAIRHGKESRTRMKSAFPPGLRFRPGNPQPVVDMYRAIQRGGESWEERADQEGL